MSSVHKFNIIKELSPRNEVFEAINAQDLLCKLIECKSITPDKSIAMDILAELLADMGFDAKIIEFFDDAKPEYPAIRNLYATRGDGAPTFGFCGHVDVVPEGDGWESDAFKPLIKDGLIYGRGSEDMKGGIATFMSALSWFLIKRPNFNGKIGIMITGAEEAQSHNGVKALCEYLNNIGDKYDVCLNAEPTNISQIGDMCKPGRRGNADTEIIFKNDEKPISLISVIKSLISKPFDNGLDEFPPTDVVPTGIKVENKDFIKGSDYVMADLSVVGKQAHSAYKSSSINPIEILADITVNVSGFAELVGAYSGFIAVNIIPANARAVFAVKKTEIDAFKQISEDNKGKAELRIEFKEVYAPLFIGSEAKLAINYRYSPLYNSESLEKEINNRLGGFDYKLKIFGIAESYVSSGNKLYRILKNSVKQVCKIGLNKTYAGGTSDTRHIYNLGISKDVVDFGMIGKTLHKANENIAIKDMEKLSKIYDTMLNDFFKPRLKVMRYIKDSIYLIAFIALFSLGLVQLKGSNEYTVLTGYTMGTYYNVKIKADMDDKQKQDLSEIIDNRLEDINHVFSMFDDTSEIRTFNDCGAKNPCPVSQEFMKMILKSIEVSKGTNGAFDATVAPLVNFWGFGYEKGNVKSFPTQSEIDYIKEHVGYNYLYPSIADLTVSKEFSDLEVDFAAIAKGYGVDEISRLIDTAGYKTHIVDIGGEVVAKGDKIWKVGVAAPEFDHSSARTGKYGRLLPVENMAVATSGDYRNFFEYDGKTYSHEIDPRTGYPSNSDLASVTVITDDCTTADAYATALMVMGKDEGLNWANENNVKALFYVRVGEDTSVETLSNEMEKYLEKY